MGCSPSAFEEASKNKAFKKDLEQFGKLQLSLNEIKKLYAIFHRMDANGGGTVDLAELLTHIDMPLTAFTKKVFLIFDDNHSGAIDFKEFVLALWNYCTLTKGTLDMFAFHLYDRDGSGELSSSEVLQMVQDIFGKADMHTDAHIKSVTAELHDFDRRKVTFTFERFRTFAKTHQAMLFPAFQMMRALQTKFLGISFWERNADRRVKLSNGKFMSVGQFIAATNTQMDNKAALSLNTPNPSTDEDVIVDTRSHRKASSKNAGANRSVKSNKIHAATYATGMPNTSLSISTSTSLSLSGKDIGESATAYAGSSSSGAGSLMTESPQRRKSVASATSHTTSSSTPSASAAAAAVTLFHGNVVAGGHVVSNSVVSPREAPVHRRGSRDLEPTAPSIIQYDKISPNKNKPLHSHSPSHVVHGAGAGVGAGAGATSPKWLQQQQQQQQQHASGAKGANGPNFGGNAFVPHDNAKLTPPSRTRRSVIIPGAVEDTQALAQHMHAANHRRKSVS